MADRRAQNAAPPDGLRFAEDLPALIGTAEEIQEAMPIRREKLSDLLILKYCLIPPTAVYSALAHEYIDSVVHQQEAGYWIEMQPVVFDEEWLKEALQPIMAQMLREAEHSEAPLEWHPDRYEFEQYLLPLIGSDKEILTATSIRREQAADLLQLKCSLKLHDPYTALAGGYIDSLIDRRQANDWIETKSVTYTAVWLKDTMKSFVMQMLNLNGAGNEFLLIEPSHVLNYLKGLGMAAARLESDKARDLARLLISQNKPGFLVGLEDDYTPAEIRALADKLLNNCGTSLAEMISQDSVQVILSTA